MSTWTMSTPTQLLEIFLAHAKVGSSPEKWVMDSAQALIDGTIPIDLDGKTVGQIVQEVNRRLALDGVEFGESDFCDMAKLCGQTQELAPYRWITVYPVRGSNEGWYIHIDALMGEGRGWSRRPLGQAKTWTRESAWEITQAAARVLGVV